MPLPKKAKGQEKQPSSSHSQNLYDSSRKKTKKKKSPSTYSGHGSTKSKAHSFSTSGVSGLQMTEDEISYYSTIFDSIKSRSDKVSEKDCKKLLAESHLPQRTIDKVKTIFSIQ